VTNEEARAKRIKTAIKLATFIMVLLWLATFNSFLLFSLLGVVCWVRRESLHAEHGNL
jgi:chromate transport protein ChrA